MFDYREIVRLNGRDLTIEQVVSVARYHAKVEIPGEVFDLINDFRAGLEVCIKRGDVMYGVNTGCGSRKSEVLSPEELSDYQMRYIPAHCCGTGEDFDDEVVRAAMVIRLNSFLNGNSGVRSEICTRLLDALNMGLTPCVPKYGSVGASGDLIPLAHTVAALIGLPEGRAKLGNEKLGAREALKRCGLEPIVLQAKEAMALTNGANFIAAIGCLAVYDAEVLMSFAAIGLSLSVEAIRGEMNAFDERVHKARPLPGQATAAKKVRQMLDGSKRATEQARCVNLPDEKVDLGKDGRKVPRVQDAYSFRCAPQIHAAAHHALKHASEILKTEINSSTDNPLIFRVPDSDEFKTLSGGNFHGQPLAAVIEYLGIALTPVAGGSDRRLFALLSSKSSSGLPSDLAGPTSGNTGLMILQYATAGVVNQIAHLANPASTHSIPTSANQEDWVSMGMGSALHLREMLPLLRFVIAAELLGAAQGITISIPTLPLGEYPLGKLTAVAYKAISRVFPDDVGTDPATWFKDRYVASDVEKVIQQMLDDGSLLCTIRTLIKD